MSSTGLMPELRAQATPLVRGIVLILTFVLSAAPVIGQTEPPSLTLVKTGALDVGGDGVATPGDLIEYTFEVTNQDPECDIEDLAVSDPLVLTIDCPSGNPIPLLANGTSETCTGSYAITQDDINAGVVYNVATASGRRCTEISVEAMNDHAEPIPQVVDIDLSKDGILQVGEDMVANPGDLITYSLEITNTGNVPLFEVTLSDPLLAAFDCPSGHPLAMLAPGASEICTGTYAIAQADIEAGFKDNTAEVSAVPSPGGTTGQPPPSVTAEASERVSIPQTPTIELAKDGILEVGEDMVANPGDLITYSLEITNTGNVPLFEVTLSDPSLAAFACPSGHPIAMLGPGESEICTGTYAITQVDIDAGFKDNSASVSGEEGAPSPTSPTAGQATAQANAQVMIPQQPSILIDKTGVLDLGGDTTADPGDVINYTFQVTNPGNVTLTGVAVADPLISPVTCPSGNPIPTLAPGGSETCTGSYALTAADITAGSVLNTADAAGMAPGSQPVSDDDGNTVTLPAPVPTSGLLGLLVLAVALAAAGALALRRRRAAG